jgi:flagellar hook-associated protein 1 FlgK
LKDSDYQMTYTTASGYSLVRMSDNQVVGTAATVGALSTAVSASEGFTIALNSGATIADGDRFLFRPASLGARDIALNITQTNDIAAASVLRTGVDTTAPLNTGNAVIGSGQFTVRTGNTLPTNNTSLSFDSANNRFDVTFADGSTATLAYNPATDSGNTLSLGILDNAGAAFGTFTFSMTGTPANGDQFVLAPNSSGIGDNRNALLLQGLQVKKIIDNGATTFQDSYGEMVAEIGVKTKQADFAAEANRVLNERAYAAHQEVSGVNLDEEAADLIRFQQAYQAVAQIISTADQLFQTLLGVVGR